MLRDRSEGEGVVDQWKEERAIQREKDGRKLEKKENKRNGHEKGEEEEQEQEQEQEQGDEEEEEQEDEEEKEEEEKEEEEKEEGSRKENENEDEDDVKNNNNRRNRDGCSRSTLELSGGQLALLGLSFVFAAALHKRNPLYLLDEVSY